MPDSQRGEGRESTANKEEGGEMRDARVRQPARHSNRILYSSFIRPSTMHGGHVLVLGLLDTRALILPSLATLPPSRHL